LIPNLITPTSLIHINFSRPEFKSIQAPIEILYTHGITQTSHSEFKTIEAPIKNQEKHVPCDSMPGGHSTLPGGSSQI